MTGLTFQETQFDIIDIHGQPWLRALQIGTALGYASPTHKIRAIFNRHRHEFTPDMSAMIELPSASGLQQTRVYSLRGVRLLAMYSQTERAAEFRAWVLDQLELLDGATGAHTLALQAEILRLQPRYKRLRDFLALGLTRKEAAGALGISLATLHRDICRLSAFGMLDAPKLLEAPRHG